MQIEEIKLKDGQLAKAHTRPTLKQIQAITRSRRHHQDEPEQAITDLVLILCTGWDVKGEGGETLSFDKDGVESAAWDTLLELSTELTKYLGEDDTVAKRLMDVADSLEDDDEIKHRIISFVASLGN